MKTVPQAEPTPQSVVVPQAELPATFPSRGRLLFARLAEQTRFAPNKETFSAVHNISVVCLPRLARSPGVSGGGAALSSLCRRFPGGDIMNLTSRRNPLSGLSFSLFFFLRERKRGYCRRRSRKISVGKTKPDSEPSPLRGRCRVVPLAELLRIEV